MQYSFCNTLLSDMNTSDMMSTTGVSTSRALVLVIIIFISSLLCLGLLYKQFPDLEE